MFIREEPTTTLADISDRLDTRLQTMAVNTADISIDPDAAEIRLSDGISVPVTADSLTALGGFIQVPTPFQNRLLADSSTDLLVTIYNELLRRSHSNVHVRYGDSGIVSVRNPDAKTIEPRRIIEVAANVISPEAPVLVFDNTPDNFALDVIVPAGFDRGVGGDRNIEFLGRSGEPQVGDISHAGLRFTQDVKHNLAPQVQPLVYRLVCTNGMEIEDKALAIDARGNTVEELLLHLEAAAQRAFDRVERDIEHFYAMRFDRVQNPDRLVARLAHENGISDRMLVALIDAVPGMNPANGEYISEFDVVNLFTNMANNPAIRRAGARRQLQRVGGSIAIDHAQRCGTCQSKLH
jgi:hypothetical protein